MSLGKKPFENIVGKGEIACTSNSPFPTMFSTLSKTEIIIFVTFNLSSENAFSLVWCKNFSCENGLKNAAFNAFFFWVKKIRFGKNIKVRSVKRGCLNFIRRPVLHATLNSVCHSLAIVCISWQPGLGLPLRNIFLCVSFD